MLITTLTGLLTPAQATTYHVKTNGSDADNGTTWATAYATLQKALSVASTGDQIWVAKGIYYPDEGGSFTDNDSIAAFTMKNGVAIYGGFAGNEASDYALSLRDFVTNETILSGEIQQDNDDSNNSEHVIYNNFNSGSPLAATAILSGFTVTKGGKISVYFTYKGGGMYNNYAHSTLTHCLFSDNKSDFGGGVYNDHSSPALTNCRFFKNQVTVIGGGIHNYNTSANPTLTRCAFSENKSVNGAGAGNEYSQGSFINCSFIQNEAVENGGGMYNLAASPVLINCLFSGNATTNSTGGYYGGGGLSGRSSGSPQLTNCVFSGNKATNGEGGGLHFYECSAVLTNCSIAGNYATFYGGGIRTISSTLTLTNCIVWGNGANPANEQDKQEVFGSIPTYTNSLVKELSGSGLLSGDQNPLFISQSDFNAAPTTAGNLRLQPCSPAINAGTNGSFTNADKDLDGNPRIAFATVDLGAYELQVEPPGTFSVNDLGDAPDATPGDGVCATAGGVCTLRAAIMETNALSCSPLTVNFSVSGIIDLSTALPNLNHPNLTITGPGASNLTVRRSLAGGTPNFSIFIVNSGKVFNLSGLKVTNGNASFTGGALFNSGGTVTIDACEFISNASTRDGGALTNQNGSMNVSNSIIKDNVATTYGGGLLNISNGAATTTTLTNCLISGNAAPGGGTAGGVDNTAQNGNSTVNLVNCTVTRNTGSGSSSFGGLGSFNAAAVITLQNTIIAGNIGTQAGGNGTITSLGNNLSSDGTGNLNASGDKPNTNPLFISGTDFRLQACSPAINAGTNTGTPTTDIFGNARVGNTDMGAYEYQGTLPTTFTVNHLGDAPDATPGDGVCATAGGVCTLRAAIMETNALSCSPLTINFSVTGTINLGGVLPDITHPNLTIQGPGAALLTVRRNSGGDYRLFNFTGNGAFATVSALTLTNGYSTGFGGAVRVNPATLTLNDCIITGNYANTGIVSATNGGLLTINRCTIFNNTADQAAGIYIQDKNVLIQNSIIRNNQASNTGGLRLNAPNTDCSMTLINTLVSGNTSTNQESAMRSEGFAGRTATVNLINCTVTNNSTTNAGQPGAVWQRPGASHVLNVNNTIVTGNTSGGAASDFTATLSPSSSNNLVGVRSELTNGTNGNLVGVNPLFVDVANGNFRLLPCSPSINAGTSTGAPANDLDGNARLYVGTASIVDIGAYEFQGDPLVSTINAPTVTQPTCATPTGTIVVNAAGNGTLEYSINNGMNWQAGNTFSGLGAGDYYLKVRFQASPACITTYATNPVVLTSPFTVPTTTDTWTGCVSTDWATPGNWQDGTVPTATDNVTIPDVANDPIIGAAAVAKSVTVQSGAVLTNNNTLTINGSATQGMLNTGTVQNNGTLAIGNTSSVGLYGLYNQAIFNNNNGGHITIDRSTSDELVNDNNGTVTNLGTIDIGGVATVGDHGIRNQANFNNNAGQININRASRGLLHQIGTFNNAAAITIGGIAEIGVIGDLGLLNLTSGTFNNNSGGQITIDRSTFAGIINQGTTFNNAGVLTIGSGASVGQYGLHNNANGSFNNNTGEKSKLTAPPVPAWTSIPAASPISPRLPSGQREAWAARALITPVLLTTTAAAA